MNRYIDADRLVAWCMRTYHAQSNAAGKAYFNAFLTAIDSCHAEDVVEVVWCKDCKKRYTEDCNMTLYDDTGELFSFAEDNDFCSYGERRGK